LCKEIDKSTPSLYRAQLEKEALQVELSWYRFDASGVESLFYQISLSNGFIVKLESWMPEATVERNDQTRFLETLSIAYEEITWSYGPDGDASFSANWREG
jgi:type VI secretion system secreted protein Hcp